MEKWCAATGHAKGAVLKPTQLWELAKRWYDDRLELDWRRLSIAERQTILEGVGLTDDFWSLSPPGQRTNA